MPVGTLLVVEPGGQRAAVRHLSFPACYRHSQTGHRSASETNCRRDPVGLRGSSPAALMPLHGPEEAYGKERAPLAAPFGRVQGSQACEGACTSSLYCPPGGHQSRPIA